MNRNGKRHRPFRPAPGPVLPCGHREHRDGHCGEMPCDRYVSKCPLHGLAPTGGTCSLAKFPVTIDVPLDQLPDSTIERIQDLLPDEGLPAPGPYELIRLTATLAYRGGGD